MLLLLLVVVVLDSFEDGSVDLGAADFLGLPRPFKLPNPLGKSLKGTTGPLTVVDTLISSEPLTGEAGVELFSWEAVEEEDEEEEFSFKVSFSFLGAEADVEELESFSVICQE